ncbi:MAG: tripartite tricarboxylate transporter TctB family protein [Rubrivivax sp.]
MNNQTLVRGLFLAAIALAFGLGALRYNVGDFARAGPGLFPLMVSSLLLLIAVATIVRSRFGKPEPLHFNPKNIALLLTSLAAFALVSLFLKMIAGIVVMVLIASRAAANPSLKRSLAVAAGLVVVAFAFQKLLGLNLPLY